MAHQIVDGGRAGFLGSPSHVEARLQIHAPLVSMLSSDNAPSEQTQLTGNLAATALGLDMYRISVHGHNRQILGPDADNREVIAGRSWGAQQSLRVLCVCRLAVHMWLALHCITSLKSCHSRTWRTVEDLERSTAGKEGHKEEVPWHIPDRLSNQTLNAQCAVNGSLMTKLECGFKMRRKEQLQVDGALFKP